MEIEGEEEESRPPRARGLKLLVEVITMGTLFVAPPAGAWIETNIAASAIVLLCKGMLGPGG